MEELEVILRRTRLQWLGHVHRTDEKKTTKAGVKVDTSNRRRRCGRP